MMDEGPISWTSFLNTPNNIQCPFLEWNLAAIARISQGKHIQREVFFHKIKLNENRLGIKNVGWFCSLNSPNTNDWSSEVHVDFNSHARQMGERKYLPYLRYFSFPICIRFGFSCHGWALRFFFPPIFCEGFNAFDALHLDFAELETQSKSRQRATGKQEGWIWEREIKQNLKSQPLSSDL